MKRPPSLKKNDKAVILSPAGKVDRHMAEGTATVLEGWGLQVEISGHALGERGRFSGTAAERLEDLQRAFDDPGIRLVLCSRGGYGTTHLLSKLDFSTIRRNPKWVVGYSDITALHAALRHHGVASVHGPMAAHFSSEGAEDVSVRYTKSVLVGQPLDYTIPVPPGETLNRNGVARGRLFGGNLSVFCSILGSRYARVPRGGILFIEDTGELPYRVDRMIYQLKLAGVFNRVSGMIVGRFTGYEEDDQMHAPLLASIREAVEEYTFPVCFHFPAGHTRLNFPLVMGGTARLGVNTGNVSLQQ
ncbi:MAG: LD-carboxypeptidase [Proteiniphilum sp.]